MIRLGLSSCLIIPFFLSACVGTPGSNGLELDPSGLSINQGSVAALAFANVCFGSKGLSQASTELAQQGNWSAAGVNELRKLGLDGVAKQVLEIPGGGGRFRETQSVFIKRFGHQAITLIIEERFDRTGLLFTTCRMVEHQEPNIPLCAAIGRTLSREPVRNAKYPKRNAHFIKWEVMLDGRPATVSCDNAPDHPVEGYQGNVISLVTDFTKPPVKSANLLSNRSVVAGHEP